MLILTEVKREKIIELLINGNKDELKNYILVIGENKEITSNVALPERMIQHKCDNPVLDDYKISDLKACRFFKIRQDIMSE